VSTERIFTRSRPASSIAATLGLVDLLVGLYDDVAGERIADVFERRATEHAVAQPSMTSPPFDQRAHLDAVERAAVALR
jgi:hypothetical protein